jgi:TolC family type I secretion outer membrane protein
MKRIHILTTLLAVVSVASAIDHNPHKPMPIPENVTLEDAIDYALQNSFAVLQAKERIEEQYGMILEARSGILPMLSLGSSISDQSDELGFFQPNSDDWIVSLQVRQALYGGGKNRSGIRAQNLQEQAALYDLQASIETAIQDVKTRFYTVILARETIKVEEQNIELLKKQLVNVESRFEAGSVSNFDVLQAKVSLANAKPALIRANNELRISVAELKKAVGYVKERDYVTEMPNFVGDLEVVKQEYKLLDSITKALEQRPELEQQKLIVKARVEGISVARAGYRPTVDLVGRYDVRRSFAEENHSFEGPAKGWFVGLESNWNIWDGRATKGRLLQAKSRLRQGELTLNETRLAVEIEVRRAVSELQSAAELVDAATQVTEQAEEALRLANERYNVGSSTLLDTLQARVSLTEARNNQLQANYSYLVALTDVQRAIGETKFHLTDADINR